MLALRGFLLERGQTGNKIKHDLFEGDKSYGEK